MTHHELSHGAWVFVGDGEKALFLINEGDEKFPNLRRRDSKLAGELARVFTLWRSAAGRWGSAPGV